MIVGARLFAPTVFEFYEHIWHIKCPAQPPEAFCGALDVQAHRPPAPAPAQPSEWAAIARIATPAAPEQHGEADVVLAAGLEPAAFAKRKPPSTPAEQVESVPRRADKTDSSQRAKGAPPTSPPRHRHLW